MIFGLLTTLYVLIALLLIPLILLQKGKGSIGIGGMGTGTQMLFGGSGGQELFQKMTWLLVALFMAGSLSLSLMRSKQLKTAKYLSSVQRPAQPS